MALKLQKEIDATGLTGDYWRIIDIYYHFDRNETVVTLALYKSQEDREAGKSPTNEIRHIVFDKIISDLRKSVYEAIKSQKIKERDENGKEVEKDGEFAEAQDC